MFGNLFEDEGGVGGAVATQGGDFIPPPPPLRNRTRLAGIWNQGSTCFLNAALQVLAYTPEFRVQLFQLAQDELGKLEEKDHNKKVREIPLQLQRLFAGLMLENHQAVSSKDVTDSFGWTSSEVGQQQDAHELYQLLLDAISQSLKGTSGERLVEDLFLAKSVNKIKCLACEHCSEREVEYSDLFVHVEGFSKGLQESLHNAYCTPEMMDGSNQYKCDRCDTHVDAARTTQLRSLPPFLKISLMRFSYDPKTWKRYKVTDSFPFPVELDMSQYTEGGQKEDDNVYELYAVIIHGGSCDGGHYTAAIRDIDNLGHWDDPDAAPAQVAVNPTSVVDCSTPQQLVALILCQQPDKTMTMDKLSADILKRTGVAWSKSYKRRHGSFPKFIKDHPHAFLVEDNMVTLLDDVTPGNISNNINPLTSAAPGSTEHVGGKEETTGDLDHSTNGLSGPEDASASSAGQRWFFFNDANASAMRAKDLQNEFAGKTSAYLLFYRRKNLPRPPTAQGNPSFGLPIYLLEEVDKKNISLLKEREEYAVKEGERVAEAERQRQEMTVEVRFHWTHTWDKGVLTSREEHTQLTCPRWNNFGTLHDTITKLGGEALVPDFKVHRMRCWDGKSHLFDELEDKWKTLEELALENGSILFVWDGKQVDEHPVPTGLDSEPISLQLKQYCSSVEMTHNFPRNLTIRQLREAVSRLTGIDCVQLRLQFPEGGVVVGGGGGEEEEGGQAEEMTLEAIHLRDGSCVLFDDFSKTSFATDINNQSSGSSSMTESAPDQTDYRFCLHIENRCDEQEDKVKWPVLELEVDKDMLVGEVKQLFMATYNICCESANLRHNDSLQGLQSPYDETSTVGNAGITKDTHLVLDSLQMTLTFKLSPQAESEAEKQALQVTVRKDCSVETCCAAMTQAAGLSDTSEWHLRKTNFFGEAAKVLEDLTQTLSQCAINPGDFLILEKGRLPPKGYMSLSVWLYAPPNQPDAQRLIESTPRIEDAGLGDGVKKVPDSPQHLGVLELSRDALLEELRGDVRDLLAHHNNTRVNLSQLRISTVEGKVRRLRRVLRGLQTSLRRLKVTGDNPIGVQLVDHDAEPRAEQMVLSVRVRGADDRRYSGPQELLWDTSQSCSAARLRQDIARHLNVAGESITIAKHFPDEYHWKILSDQIQAVQGHIQNNNNKKGKKRTHAVKSNIRLKPFFVQDGDVIGVIAMPSQLLDGASPTADDFSTPEDQEGLQQMLEKVRQKQLERQARQLVDGLTFPGQRRPQVPLRIKIGDFT